ncbi:PPK2 family polyphosphate kinase [Streptomyces sp. NPDC048338]|uniref:PPK2 family polyphosphate kinase n=1 Tax=Streptomyces sp. NPDC048338 TaxID=3365536 RepID=UPI00370FD587
MAKDGKTGKTGKGKAGKSGGKAAGKKDRRKGVATSAPAPRTPLRELLRLPVGEPVDLSAYGASSLLPGAPADKSAGVAATAATAPALAGLQERLYAASTAGDHRRLLLVLQGMDTSGKGGTVKHVIGFLNPSGCRIRAFKAPTEEERNHPFLWRVGRALPSAGEIGIFDRSHYEDVLIARVRDLAPREEIERRYEEINRFEASLVDDGVTVVKVFLHVSYEEQRARLLERLDNPDKHWKFSPGDIEDRALWPAYQRAYEIAMERCATDGAPWYIVPADRKWYRNWAIGTLLREHLEELDPRYPKADFDVAESRRTLLAS